MGSVPRNVAWWVERGVDMTSPGMVSVTCMRGILLLSSWGMQGERTTYVCEWEWSPRSRIGEQICVFFSSLANDAAI